jgi:hypothetical protein
MNGENCCPKAVSSTNRHAGIQAVVVFGGKPHPTKSQHPTKYVLEVAFTVGAHALHHPCSLVLAYPPLKEVGLAPAELKTTHINLEPHAVVNDLLGAL